MSYHFLENCVKSRTTDRIMTLPTASQNSVMTLLIHGTQPNFNYADTSHSNIDVHIAYIKLLHYTKISGVIAFNDIGIGAAFDSLVKKYYLGCTHTFFVSTFYTRLRA